MILPGEVLDALQMVLHARGIVAEMGQLLERLREAVGERYHVVAELGRGAMGVVYLAYETALQRPVALKVLPPPLAADREKREQFLREARTAARLRHPNIVPIHAVEEAGDLVFFTMDHVEGETLGQRVMSRGPLPVGEAIRILHAVAGAVGYAHRRGVVHRDLKPDNIMIETGSGRALVMDFGIAHAEWEPEIDRAGYVTGTAPFMSPEQVRGGMGDERSDVYALGITAYFAVTGHLPFDGDTVEDIFAQHVLEVPPGLRVYGENLDGTYSRVVQICLAKDPRERFRNGDDLADALAQAPELRRRDLPVPLRAFVRRVQNYWTSNSGISVLVTGALLALGDGIRTADWAQAGWAVGFLGMVIACAFLDLVPIARRVLEEGYGHGDMVHALSVCLEREREAREFEYGSVSPGPARLARRVAYGGLALAGLGAGWSLVGSLNPAVGLGALLGGIVIAITASAVGFLYTRSRLDPVGAWWLRFWRSPAGELAARLAAFRLRAGPAPEPEAPEIAMLTAPSYGQVRIEATRHLVNQVPAIVHLATSRIQRVRDWMDATNTFETSERTQAAPDAGDVRRRLEESSMELQRLRYRLGATQPGDTKERLRADFEAVRRLCEVVDGLLEGARRPPEGLDH